MKMKLPKIKMPDVKSAIKKKPQIEKSSAEKTDEPRKSEDAFRVNEGMLRKIWAGEITAAVLLSFASIIIAFAG